jgi:hypothetical protein
MPKKCQGFTNSLKESSHLLVPNAAKLGLADLDDVHGSGKILGAGCDCAQMKTHAYRDKT